MRLLATPAERLIRRSSGVPGPQARRQALTPLPLTGTSGVTWRNKKKHWGSVGPFPPLASAIHQHIRRVRCKLAALDAHDHFGQHGVGRGRNADLVALLCDEAVH